MSNSIYIVISRDRDGSEYVNETNVDLRFEDLVTKLGEGAYGYNIASIHSVDMHERSVRNVTFDAITELVDRYDDSGVRPDQDVRDMIREHSEFLGWHLGDL